MPIPLTDELLRAIDESVEQPPRLVDPATNTTYILLRADAYAELLHARQEEHAEEHAWLDVAEEAQLDWLRENPY